MQRTADWREIQSLACLKCVTDTEKHEIQTLCDITNCSLLSQSVFLPQGYPESVSEDYLQYQFWDTVQVHLP